MTLNELLNGFRRAAVRSALGFALLVPAAYGCGDVENNYYGDEGGNGKVESKICSKYFNMCPSSSNLTEDSDFLSACIQECEKNKNYDNETCGFVACAVETGYCDNEVGGDPQITSCMEEHGWLY